MAYAAPMVNANELLTRIRNDVEADRLKPIHLAREAGLQPTTVYTMLLPDWSNRAVDNIEALAVAYERIAKEIPDAGKPRKAVRA